MRWENLFDDLEFQLDAEAEAELRDRERDAERQEFAHITLIERLRVCAETEAIQSITLGGVALSMCVEMCGLDWFAGHAIGPAAYAGYLVAPVSAIENIALAQSVARSNATEAISRKRAMSDAVSDGSRPHLRDRIPFRIVLRDLCRRRKVVIVHTGTEDRLGTLDRVGSDHCDLACHRSDESRRDREVAGVDVIALGAISWVQVVA